MKVMLVAAEASGDALGAGLVRALKSRLGEDVGFVGVGGPRMAAEGVASAFDISDLAILGALEGLVAYPRVLRRAEQTVSLAEQERPDVAVLIDSWGFTLRVAQRLRRRLPALPIIKYVGPQVWATRPGRAKTLSRTVDRLLAIHVFDAPIFEAAGLPTTFVGNPALARDFSAADPQRLRTEIGAGPDDPILLVLPGSRTSELRHVLPPFEDAVHRLKAERSGLQVVVPAAESVAEAVKARVAGWPFRAHVVEGEGARFDAMKAATVALACSGTVTTELALAGCPMVVAYRFGAVTAFIARRLIRTPWVTLFNIAARDFVAPEMIQERCNGADLAAEVARRLDDPDLRASQVAAQYTALEAMGRGIGDPSGRAADAVIEAVTKRRPG